MMIILNQKEQVIFGIIITFNLKDRELKGTEVKIKRKIEELFFKSIIAPIDDLKKFQVKEMKKIRPIKKTWYD